MNKVHVENFVGCNGIAYVVWFMDATHGDLDNFQSNGQYNEQQARK